jgi:RNA polymerase sigma-70 factor (ECF subfamily)
MDTSSTLLRRVRDTGDAEGWREFVALYEPLIVRYALGRGRGLSEPDARDVAQDVFARLLKALPGFELDRARGRFRTYLWQVTASALADRARRGQRRAEAEREWLAHREDPDERAEWDRAFRRRVLGHALDRAREATSPAAWACFERHVLGREPAAAVARGRGVSADAVFVHSSNVLSRVRARCAECLEDLSDDPQDLPGGA